jgi:hypothetical protein
VFKTGNYNLVPILSSMVGLVSSICWLMYSLTKSDAIDINIFIPNAMGIVLLIIQVVVWIHFYNKKKKSDEEENFISNDEEKTPGNKL